jgi:hypothetical protein
MQYQLDLRDEPQPVHLRRVKGKTAHWIETFFSRLPVGATFHAQELRDFVATRTSVAPASPDRILRDMRRCGQIDYEVVNRRDSLYRKMR